MSHTAAQNTLISIENMYNISEEDTILGIAELSFDLSVFDIFSVLGVGGTLVLPNPEKGPDASHWGRLLNEYKVTLWNSVPAFMARLMEHNEVKERISLLPIDVGKYSFRDKISGVMCMGVLGHLKRDEQEKLLYKLDKNLNINVPILIELLEPKFLVAPVGSRISVATQGRLRYETYITDIKQVGMDQWTWRLTYKVFCGKKIVSTVDSLMSWNYQSVEKF